MKTAFYQIETISLSCPHCGEFLEGEDGIQNFQIDDLILLADEPRKCEACGKESRIPKSLIKKYGEMYR